MLPDGPIDERLVAGFLAGAGWAGVPRCLLAADASFRRYDRLHDGSRSAVLMLAPPEREKPQAFVDIAGHLAALGLGAPGVLAAAPDLGLVLLEDLGDSTFTRALAAGADEADLYRLATDVLVHLHERWPAGPVAGLAPYDEAVLLGEAALFLDWGVPAFLGRSATADERDGFLAAWSAVLPLAARLQPTLVLRDFHVDNLMVLAGREGVAACGLLDFQDALLGPPAYDLVSLLRDARRDVDPAVAEACRERYLAGRPGVDRAAFERAYWILGAQRTTKILGIFVRLWRRDGKPRYLTHLPRLWRLLDVELAQPVLAPVRAWFDTAVPAGRRRGLSPEEGG